MFKSLYRTHCRKTGIGAEMLWVRLRSIIPADLLTIVESKTSRSREVGTENATPPRHSPQQVQENLGTMKAYLVDARGHPRFKLEVDIRKFAELRSNEGPYH